MFKPDYFSQNNTEMKDLTRHEKVNGKDQDVESQANSQELHGLLLIQRFQHPSTFEKYKHMKKRFPPEGLPEYEGMIFKKREPNQADIEQMIEEYSLRVGGSLSTQYVPSEDYGYRPKSLGVYTKNVEGENLGYGEGVDVVFKNAKKNNNPLTIHQKSIIENHEKIHKLMDGLTLAEKEYILAPFDLEKKIPYKNRLLADEYLARMSQLKSYFGFSGDEELTRQHLDYARENYVKDTGLDNSMEKFFSSIENEEVFLEVINNMPC